MLTKRFLHIHKLTISIILFVLLFGSIHWLQPSLIYNEDGGFRPFGVGYKHKTVIPMWVTAIILAIFVYMAVLCAITYY
jgi:hypothetical protein